MAVSSDKITVFPCIKRDPAYNTTSKLMSEQNITNIIKSIVGDRAYVISEISNGVEFIIQGYYFNYTFSANDTENNVYASIVKDGDPSLLKGDDQNGYFNGLNISYELPTGQEGKDYLTLYEKAIKGAPPRSKIIFNPEVINIPTILDIGELK